MHLAEILLFLGLAGAYLGGTFWGNAMNSRNHSFVKALGTEPPKEKVLTNKPTDVTPELTKLKNYWLDSYLNGNISQYDISKAIGKSIGKQTIQNISGVLEDFNRLVGDQQVTMKELYDSIVYEETLKRSNLAYLGFLKSYLTDVDREISKTKGESSNIEELLNRREKLLGVKSELDNLESEKRYELEALSEHELSFRESLNDLGRMLKELSSDPEAEEEHSRMQRGRLTQVLAPSYHKSKLSEYMKILAQTKISTAPPSTLKDWTTKKNLSFY